MGQSLQIYLHPGPALWIRPDGAQSIEHQSDSDGEEQHGAEVSQAVLNETVFQAKRFGSAPYQYNGPGVEKVEK